MPAHCVVAAAVIDSAEARCLWRRRRRLLCRRHTATRVDLRWHAPLEAPQLRLLDHIHVRLQPSVHHSCRRCRGHRAVITGGSRLYARLMVAFLGTGLVAFPGRIRHVHIDRAGCSCTINIDASSEFTRRGQPLHPHRRSHPLRRHSLLCLLNRASSNTVVQRRLSTTTTTHTAGTRA